MGRRAPIAETLLALAVVASCASTALTFHRTGYLPQPFVFDTNDTFMDWFNTAYWAHHPGAYDVWQSIYPPLSFVFLKLAGLPGCYLDSPFYARDCDWLGQAVIVALYVLDATLVWASFRRADRGTAPMRGIAFALGLPLLFTLERGNLILACLACFVIAHGPLRVGRGWRAVATAASINFKPYLLVPALALAIERRWRALELAGITTIALYLATLALIGSGTPMTLAANTAHWIVFQGGQVWNEVNYSTSYASLLALVRSPVVPVLDYIPSRTVEGIETVVPMVIRASQGMALLALAGAWVQPGVLSRNRIAALMLGAYLVTQSPGGYTQAFLVFLVFLEPWQRPGPIVALVLAYLLCLVGDWTLARVIEISSNSWLSGRPVSPSFGLTLGQLVRPGLLVVMVWSLALDSLWLVACAHRMRRPTLTLSPA